MGTVYEYTMGNNIAKVTLSAEILGRPMLYNFILPSCNIFNFKFFL